MRAICLNALLAAALLVPAAAVADETSWHAHTRQEHVDGQQREPGRGDDLERNEAWRAFLTRAHRAFTAAHMSTEAVKAKIEQADERVAELKEAQNDPRDEGGRPDITADVAFLERAHRAFTAAHMSTREVSRWLREARETGDGQVSGDGQGSGEGQVSVDESSPAAMQPGSTRRP